MRNYLIIVLLLLALVMAVGTAAAQGMEPRPMAAGMPVEGDLDKASQSIVVRINTMDEAKRDKLNDVAASYRSQRRGVFSNIAMSMLSGGVGAVVNVIGTEIINLMQIRSKQKKAWLEMRRSECTFVDTLKSVKGQSDFYGRLSNYGPLDPSDMNFDGFTLVARRDGKEVLRMVCHIDTTRFDHMFMHSKFYLVLDSLVFYPYRSFLPNMQANYMALAQSGKITDEDLEYCRTISQFSFANQQNPSIHVKMDVTSSWINELVQIQRDVHLGTFEVDVPISERDVNDSVYVYTRAQALEGHGRVIDITGDCFVVPRSYMPVSATNPSWGTGEYKLQVVLSEQCRFNPQDERSRDWRRDYKQLKRLRNGGKDKNEYWSDIVTTFRDNKNTIIKAIYSPALNAITQAVNPNSKQGAASVQAMMQGMGGAAAGNPKQPTGSTPPPGR